MPAMFSQAPTSPPDVAPEPRDVAGADVEPPQAATRPAVPVATKQGRKDEKVNKVTSSLPTPRKNPSTKVLTSTERDPPRPPLSSNAEVAGGEDGSKKHSDQDKVCLL